MTVTKAVSPPLIATGLPAPLAPTPPNPLVILQSAVERGTDPSQLERIMEMCERYERNRAAERFGESLARFQADCHTVGKSRTVFQKDGETVRYKFAGFEDVWLAARPYLTANNISVSFWQPKETDGLLTIMCRVQVGAHFEDRPFTARMPNIEAMCKANFISEEQAWGRVLSYFKRYAFCAALGVVVADEDNDAAKDIQNVGEGEIGALNKLIVEKRVNRDLFFKWASTSTGTTVDRLDKLPMSAFQGALDMLKRKKVTPETPEANGKGGGK